MPKIKQKIEWKVSKDLTDYNQAVEFMEQRVRDISDNKSSELIWLVTHPPIYTAGISARDSDLLDDKIPVYKTNRGGKYTYHDPGMRIIYVMIDLRKYFAPNNPDIAEFVKMLERWIINVLSELEVKGEIRKDRVGIWVNSKNGTVPNQLLQTNSRHFDFLDRSVSGHTREPKKQNNEELNSKSYDLGQSHNGKESKIAALGIKIKKWVSYHGIALNINPDLSGFDGIVPCGIKEFGVTSLFNLGKEINFDQIDKLLKTEFYKVFINYTER